MTRKLHHILLEPPQAFPEHTPHEQLISTGHKCPLCSGNGYHWKREGRAVVQATCQQCHGTGFLHAIVQITWKGGNP